MCCLGAKIDWVQCDGCELWYHLKCVGLSPDQCNDDDEYHCPACTRRRSPPAAPPSPPTSPRHTSKSSYSTAASSPTPSAARRKTPKRPERVNPVPNSKLKASMAKTVVTAKTVVPAKTVVTSAAVPVSETVKQTVAVVSSAVSSKDSPSTSVDSNPLRTVAAGGGFAAFARPGSFGGAKLFEFSTLAKNAVRRPSTTTTTTCSTSSNRDDSPGKSLSATTGSSFTFGQYLYTPWLAKSALAPR